MAPWQLSPPIQCKHLQPNIRGLSLATYFISLVPRPIPLKSHRSGVFGDVRITSGGRDLSECADLSDRAGRAPAVVKR